MATAHSTRRHPLLCFCIFLSSMLSLSHGRLTPNFKIRAVNLGGWLVAEKWIKPSLFDGIPNNDFLDGTRLHFKSVTAGKYLCAETGGGSIIVANRTVASGWETFKLWRINETSYQLRVFNKQFVGVDSGGNGIDMVAIVAGTPGRSETFEIVRNSDDPNRIRIKAPNGFFLQVKIENLVTADSKGDGSWGNDDQSVFIITNTGGLHGEFQLTNGYGPVNAPQVMTEHWNTFIVEDDFNFISSNGINAVRIPVGWWIASDPTPPQPYVGGSLQALDNAFIWAQYANNPHLYAVELINEPLSPGATVESLNKYYRAGYNAVRKYSSTAYVILSNRIATSDPKEFFSLASGLDGSVIDIHYYNLYSHNFDKMSVQQNIDFIYNNRLPELNQLTTSNGPLTFIGEWVAEWNVGGATKEDYQKFANAQLDVYGKASFGWAYWNLKNVNNHWNLEWMINNHYIML
ncbi:hypothetical protein TEA_001719 [Camellia sinensis var. sinensis]|uniref:Uncharacterized protein n=1 Tax=Camellia sinensis var. sinensis TaxID=542762 RepID=A0A4S4DJU4_CAMSN|nr:hypothetical protein TEA_001719 [Camellia sinensis var. sinensis]